MSIRTALTQLKRIAVLAVSLTIVMASAAVAQETIDATAMGTSTQLGKSIAVKIIITSWSTKEDQQTLNAAFNQGQNDGLVKALQKMKSVGRIQIPGTVGYDIAYAISIPTTTGHTVRFVTNRKIAFGEAANNTQSMAYNLTGGEINIDDSDQKKSAGVLYPAAQMVINKDGELQIELRKNPWKLVNIIVRGKTEN